jgi:hypothetical protein
MQPNDGKHYPFLGYRPRIERVGIPRQTFFPAKKAFANAPNASIVRERFYLMIR